MPPRPNQKRSHASSSSQPGPSSKKTRFVEPSEDPAKFAEEVDAALENPSATRKGRVKTEGYDSDSSDDGEGVVPSRRPGSGKGEGGEEEDEDDMFAMADKEEKDEEEKGKQKGKGGKEEFLRLGDIEGQEFGRNGSDDEDDEDSEEGEDEPEDEDDAERRRKAGMGYELSSFNMREEMEEGKFSADGMYVRTFDPHALHDKWMDGLDEKEIKLARKRKKAQDRKQRERIKAEEKELEESGGRPAIELHVLSMLKKGESVLEALQRLGVKAKKNKPNGKTKSAKANLLGDDMQVDSNPNTTAKSTSPNPTSDIDQLTHWASTLMSLGDTDIYSKTYEELVRSVRSSGTVDASWVPPSADVKYEYKWDVPGAQDGQVFGPYSEDEMRAWYKASYFGPTGDKINVRPLGGEWAGWDDVFS